MRAYWDGLAQVHGPRRATGLAGDEQVADFVEILAATGFTLTGRVLDIGCGTGRLAVLTGDYTGVDISPEMVAYARAQGRNVALIEGPESLAELGVPSFDRVCLFSVFTHVDRATRAAYLAAIADLLAPGGEVLVDVFVGPEEQSSLAFSYTSDFRAELDGWLVITVFERHSWDGALHTYYCLARAES